MIRIFYSIFLIAILSSCSGDNEAQEQAKRDFNRQTNFEISVNGGEALHPTSYFVNSSPHWRYYNNGTNSIVSTQFYFDFDGHSYEVLVAFEEWDKRFGDVSNFQVGNNLAKDYMQSNPVSIFMTQGNITFDRVFKVPFYAEDTFADGTFSWEFANETPNETIIINGSFKNIIIEDGVY